MDFRPAAPHLALALAIAALGSACAGHGQAPQAAATGTDGASVVLADAHAVDGRHAHEDPHDGQADPELPVPDGHTPWAPDAPLIEGMSRIRAAIAGLEAHPDAATVAGHAAEVDAAIDYIFANCRLETDPDVALHAILARLMAATGALHADPADASAVDQMHAAVRNYDALFDDPGA